MKTSVRKHIPVHNKKRFLHGRQEKPFFLKLRAVSSLYTEMYMALEMFDHLFPVEQSEVREVFEQLKEMVSKLECSDVPFSVNGKVYSFFAPDIGNEVEIEFPYIMEKSIKGRSPHERESIKAFAAHSLTSCRLSADG